MTREIPSAQAYAFSVHPYIQPADAEVNAFERLQICPRPEFFVLRLKIQIVNCACEVFWSFQLPLHESFVDDYLGGDTREFAFLPRFYLLSHRFETALHSVDAY